jgi:hypothetical protein
MDSREKRDALATRFARYAARGLRCHSRESGNPESRADRWIPAFAGMTKNLNSGLKTEALLQQETSELIAILVRSVMTPRRNAARAKK